MTNDPKLVHSAPVCKSLVLYCIGPVTELDWDEWITTAAS